MKVIAIITFIVLVASAGCRKPKRYRHKRWTPPSEFGTVRHFSRADGEWRHLKFTGA